MCSSASSRSGESFNWHSVEFAATHAYGSDHSTQVTVDPFSYYNSRKRISSTVSRRVSSSSHTSRSSSSSSVPIQPSETAPSG